MNAEIIAIGTELLLGEISDTNSTYIARALRDIGLDLYWISSVGDNEERIAELVKQASRRSSVVITTGGLGPTVDDPTRAAIARACGLSLEYRPELWAQIEARFRRFGRTPTENNRQQAFIPAGALALENPVGTAPCFIVEQAGSVIIALPGVPREMEHMLAQVVVPYLREKFKLASVIKAKVLRTVGIGESTVDEQIGDLEKLTNPTVGLAAHAGQTDIRVTAKAASAAEAEAMIATVEAKLRERLGDFIYGEGQETVEAVVGRLLIERRMTLALAEAGGDHLAQRLTALPQAEQFFRGSASLTTNASSTPIAEAAARARAELKADWGLGVRVNLEVETGQIEIALIGAGEAETHSLGYGGPPALAARWAGTAALNLLRLKLLK